MKRFGHFLKECDRQIPDYLFVFKAIAQPSLSRIHTEPHQIRSGFHVRFSCRQRILLRALRPARAQG